MSDLIRRGVAATSLGCARCGACCEQIPLTGSLEQFTAARAAGDYDGNPRMIEDVDFMAAHWTPLPEQPDRYACDQFDVATRTCMAQDSKPPVCRDYPWYQQDPRPDRAAALPTQCSYLLDVPPAQRPEGARPLIPIEVIR